MDKRYDVDTLVFLNEPGKKEAEVEGNGGLICLSLLVVETLVWHALSL